MFQFSPCSTAGNRLGYVNDMFVNPADLAVASLYLRQSPTGLAAANTSA